MYQWINQWINGGAVPFTSKEIVYETGRWLFSRTGLMGKLMRICVNCQALSLENHYYSINSRSHPGTQWSWALWVFGKRNWGFQEWEAVLHSTGIKSTLPTEASGAMLGRPLPPLGLPRPLFSFSASGLPLHWSSRFSDQPAHGPCWPLCSVCSLLGICLTCLVPWSFSSQHYLFREASLTTCLNKWLQPAIPPITS